MQPQRTELCHHWMYSNEYDVCFQDSSLRGAPKMSSNGNIVRISVQPPKLTRLKETNFIWTNKSRYVFFKLSLITLLSNTHTRTHIFCVCVFVCILTGYACLLHQMCVTEKCQLPKLDDPFAISFSCMWNQFDFCSCTGYVMFPALPPTFWDLCPHKSTVR